ncbi:alpha/beta fold hydrolase [Colwellia echini]|uniref:Alpha/beta fold hydrolase n=1 Tax=Colwellia echini TaxID=1982103 RepID=A0ABY3MY01_9GAMM|nr:alpha/beta fold hydrolase [Colwellia echini]TYK66059.1 alpha/beta fold hydrolase [Colwellia echini]
MKNSVPFTPENKLLDKLSNEIMLFWQRGEFSSFFGVNKLNIHYAYFIHTSDDDGLSNKVMNKPTIVIVPGRGEGYLKYQELAFDLYQQGYNIFIIDHRGQGLSDRLLANVNKGYVVNFQDYVTDLHYFIENIVIKLCHAKPYLLAHSMGGAIALRFMQDSPQAIKAAVIASPMLGFNSGYLPQFIAKKIIALRLAVNNLSGNEPGYFWGQKDYLLPLFSKNKLTHSTTRFQAFVELYKENKLIQLGGVTTHWLMQGILAQKEIFAKLRQLKTPILLLQAKQDKIVCLQAQTEFCRKLHTLHPQSCPNGLPYVIEDAYHELFFETDNFRNKALSQTLNWFKQHN